MNRVLQLTRQIWSGSRHGDRDGTDTKDGYYDYTDVISVLFTTLDRLKADGPRRAVW
ncbi:MULTISPECIES: hypothetical protein [Streptomyces]|uniref:hypothetical protein n=1 Tax=Streptomyces TaxID=1883 RepID=UPI00292E9D10|nr:hypothetical protein [Streptomyces sp. NEAU-HV9]